MITERLYMVNDDIVDRLRKCYCGEGFANRGLVDPACDHDGVRAEAADEIESLRQLADNLVHHLQGYVCHCNMSKCKCGYDDIMDEYKSVRGE